MALCGQAASHYLNGCWQIPWRHKNGVTRGKELIALHINDVSDLMKWCIVMKIFYVFYFDKHGHLLWYAGVMLQVTVTSMLQSKINWYLMSYNHLNKMIGCQYCSSIIAARGTWSVALIFFCLEQTVDQNTCTYSCVSINYNVLELKIRTTCHAPDLWKLALSCKMLHLQCLPNPWNLPGTA